MKRLLTIATAICGWRASHSVIEPLLADWQRELEAARARGLFGLALVSAAGAFALVRSMIACAIAEGLWVPPLRATALSILAIAFSLAVSTALLLTIAPMPSGFSRNPVDPLAQGWLLVMTSTVLPPAFLLAMFIHRRDARATMRHAIIGAAFVAIATTAVVITTNPEAINRRYNTFEFQERIRERTLAAAKSNPSIYKGNSYQRTLATTVEQRRASFDLLQSYLAKTRQHDPPPTWAERFAQLQPILLAIVFAAIGWTLAGLAQPSLTRGLIWWALVFLATIAMTNLLSLLVGVPMPRPPQWVMLPLFASISALLIAAARVRTSRLGGHS
jgi:hypothetical protein